MAATGTSGIARMMRLRLAEATPSRYVDAIVVAAGETSIELALFGSGERRVLAHADASLCGLTSGTPVAVHEVYGVLAYGEVRADVLDLSSL